MEENQSHRISRFLQLQRRITVQYDRSIAAAAERLALTRPEADVLLFLVNNPAFHTARDVAAYRGFSKTYVSKALEGLAARGLVTAEADPTDRRVQNLRLTPEAARPARALQAAQQAFFLRLTAGASPEDAAALERLGARIEKNLEADAEP